MWFGMDTGVGLMQNKKRQTYQSDKKASVCSCQLNHLFIYLVKFNARVHSTIGNHADSLQSTLYAIYNVIYFAMWSTYLCAQWNTIHRIRFRLTHQAVIEYCKRFTRTSFWSLLCLSFICTLLLFSIFCQGDFLFLSLFTLFRIWSFMFRIS